MVRNIPGALVLACTPSNSAADLIAEKLLGHLQAREVYRMNAFSRPLGTIPDKLKVCLCIWKSNCHYFTINCVVLRKTAASVSHIGLYLICYYYFEVYLDLGLSMQFIYVLRL